MSAYAASYMMSSTVGDTFQQSSQTGTASRAPGEETIRGNKWHQKMGIQKPQNLDQSISQIHHNEYAPFTRQAEQPSLAQLYIRQYFGDRGRQDESSKDREGENDQETPGPTKGFGRRASNSPHRRGPGPEWGNSHFGTKPRRRSIVEDDRNRALLDENAPPLLSFYDDLIAKERASLAKKEAHQMGPSTQSAADFRNSLHYPASATDLNLNLNVPVPSDRPIQKFILHHPRAVRVSNYSESRWPDVLAALARFGQILERFSIEQPKNSPYHPVPVKILAESDDPVVRDARLIYTDEGWTKVTYSTKEAAEMAVSMSGSIFVGGRPILIEYWNQELHNVKTTVGVSTVASIFETGGGGQGNLFALPAVTRQQSFPSQPDDLPFSTSISLSTTNVTQPNNVRNRMGTFDSFTEPSTSLPSSSDSAIKLSTQMPGAKLATLKEVPGGVFVKKPSIWSRLLSWITGDLFKADGRRVVDSSWFGWAKDWLFGRL